MPAENVSHDGRAPRMTGQNCLARREPSFELDDRGCDRVRVLCVVVVPRSQTFLPVGCIALCVCIAWAQYPNGNDVPIGGCIRSKRVLAGSQVAMKNDEQHWVVARASTSVDANP